MKLLIISHTEHYRLPDGRVVGWGATVREINALADMFSHIYHIGMLYDGAAPASALPYTSDHIQLVPLQPMGGNTMKTKLQLLWQMPDVVNQVFKLLKEVDYFQFRAPTGMGVVLIPIITLFSKKKGWFKYAGNWNQQNPPLGYAWQRWCLKQQKSRKLTINGFWPNQPAHCISFENPCLTAEEFARGADIIKSKTITNAIDLCYAGRVEDPKGVGRLLEAYCLLDVQFKARISGIHIVGEGKDLHTLRKRYSHDPKVIFYGGLPSHQLFDLYVRCQLFVMPTTASEGFPKVLTEAMNFGCIPIVSNISAIGHYVQHKHNGWLLEQQFPEHVANVIQMALQTATDTHQQMMQACRRTAVTFTFNHYKERLKNDILEASISHQ